MTYNAVLSHQSALVFYLSSARFTIKAPYREGFDQKLPTRAPAKTVVKLFRHIMDALPYSGNTIIDMARKSPLQFAVALRQGVHHTQDQCTHVISNTLPKGSILWVKAPAGTLTLVSPELCFMLAAQYCSIHELIYIGNLLCANFAFIYGNGLSTLQEREYLLTTPEKIAAYIESAPNIPGKKLAKRACQYILAGALSPRECMLSMFFRLPKRLGGLGISDLTLNQSLNLIDPATSNWIRLRPDFLFKNAKNGNCVALEYNSDEHHSAKDHMFKDVRRKEIFEANGYKMLTLKTSDCYQLDILNDYARSLCTLLDQKRPKNISRYTYSDGSTQKSVQERLYRYLFDNLSQLKCIIPPEHKHYECVGKRHSGKRLTLIH